MTSRKTVFLFVFAALWLGGQAPARGEAAPPGPPPGYEALFTDEALRVDLVHTGGPGDEELFSLDELVREPLWPGRRQALIDPTDYGHYRFRVFDAASGRLIFSQGYSSLFGEWRTTPEADRQRRSLEESLRLPMPRAPVRIVIDRRTPQNGWEEIYSMDLAPRSRSIRWERRYDFPVVLLQSGGPPAEAVDVLILGDGYSADEVGKLRADARRFAQMLLLHEPYRRNRERISIRAVEVESRESGVDEPRKGIWRDTALSCSFDTLGIARYLMTTDDRALRDIASLAPYDTIYIMVNTARYGGGGIYGLYAAFAADSDYSEYVYLHEFGHSFGALGDEYSGFDATSFDLDAFTPLGVEPWEPNLTALLDPGALRWADLVQPGTPIPTPATAQFADRVGAFEGGGYRDRGIYRPCLDSIMLSTSCWDYCPVSERAIERLIRWVASGGWR